MKAKDVIEYFGTQTEVAKQLGIKQASVSGWAKSGLVPKLRQYQIEKVTNGKLKVGEK